MIVEEATARRGGREARRAMRTAPKVEMLPTLTRGLPVVEPMSAEHVAYTPVVRNGCPAIYGHYW